MFSVGQHIVTAAQRTSWKQSTRTLFGMLNPIWNKVDKSRIREVGPDAAAAEWLLRCGAAVRFKGLDRWSDDYNLLPKGPKYVITEIDATDSCVMHIGFPYLENLRHVRTMKLHHCTYVTDPCLAMLHPIKDSLEELQVTSCGEITDRGLTEIHKLHNLQKIFLADLPAVQDVHKIIDIISKELPKCEIRHFSVEGLKELKMLGKDKPCGVP